jgi:hypothetical protein
LIVAPTHAECRVIARDVRDRRKKDGSLSRDEHTIRRLEKLNLTENQRRDAEWEDLSPLRKVEVFNRRFAYVYLSLAGGPGRQAGFFRIVRF